MNRFTFSPGRYRARWFCYLDLLGFTQLVLSQRIEEVMLGYEDALSDLRRSKPQIHEKSVLYSWFSDTFIIYSTGDTSAHFAAVESVGRVFFQKLILRHVPVRGAITHGELYSQARRNIFVGPALIDAYHHAENQNWLGFVLTQKAIEKMAACDLPVSERPFYRPIPPNYMHKESADPLYGFAFNNGSSPYRAAIQAMKSASGEDHAGKYDRTLQFIVARTFPEMQRRREGY